ncbi:MAG TPA: PQQ-binding-like beta-propeller repeat protein, partial [Ktedonobacterales bacterium]|nr:PQQ-binding-like beta-propeller repeat protein [Ktedonobacterales bacterium]
MARRITNGGIQWQLPITRPNGHSVIQYGDTLYAAHSDAGPTEIVEAIRARDGHVQWRSTRQGYDLFGVLGIHGTQLVGWYRSGPTGKGRAVALDIRTGRTLWATPELTDAMGYLATNDILICQSTSTDGQINTYRLTDLDSVTGVQRWSDTLSIKQGDPPAGYNCVGTTTIALMLPESAQSGKIYAFDIQSGVQLWQAPANGNTYLSGYDQDRVYVSTQ